MLYHETTANSLLTREREYDIIKLVTVMNYFIAPKRMDLLRQQFVRAFCLSNLKKVGRFNEA